MSSFFPTLPNLPAYLADETLDAIRSRMLAPLKAKGIDTSEGSLAWDIISAYAMEEVQLKANMREQLKRPFARYTYGPYLAHIGEQRAGITYNDAVAARTVVRFTGTAGTAIATTVQVSTQLLPGSTDTAIVFSPVASATIGGGGVVDVLCQCTVAGVVGNVEAGTLKVLVTSLDGVTVVTNPTAVGDGPDDVKGADKEPDATFLTRYLQAVYNPPGSGNLGDYVRWALEVPGIGGVYPESRPYGPNTVRLVLVGTDLLPASQAVREAVEDYLYAPYRVIRQAEVMTLGGSGSSIDGTAVKLIYDVAGAATITDRLDSLPLPQAGIWRLMLATKVDGTAGANDLLQAGVYNISRAGWAKQSWSGTTDALITKKASDLTTDFLEFDLEFYWNGSDQIELRITRLQTDTTTQVWIDQARFLSTFMQADATPKAPTSDRFFVESARQVTINVGYHPIRAVGADPTATDAAVATNLQAYLQGLTLTQDNDVRYVRVGSVILDTTGMVDYTGLTVNGGTGNVVIGPDEVAVLGTVTIT